VVPANGLAHDLNAIAAAVTKETNVIYLANPNNPTGTYFLADEFAAFMAKVPWNVVVVLDQAYAEYLPSDEMLSSVSFAKSYPNVILVRTFSKAYGLAGLRVGFAIGRPELIGPLNQVRTPFNVTTLGQVAAAAAIGDTEFVKQTRTLNQAGMKFVVSELARAGFTQVPSVGNFVLVEVGDAMAVHRELMSRSVIVRPVANYGLPTWLRISIGLPEENQIMIRALRAITGKAHMT
jgi:histidinol-phosphate aminotransferase